MLCLLLAASVAMSGCWVPYAGNSAGSATTSATAGAHMAGPALEVNIPQSAISAKPKPWDLSTPRSAVGSYLDWVSYAYRIATSDAATPTMAATEAVRVDSYIQFNLEKKRIIDQSLTTITFGSSTVEATHTLLSTKEEWTYSYRSIDVGNAVIGGPYTATYDVVYTLVKLKDGHWVVDSVKATPAGTVK